MSQLNFQQRKDSARSAVVTFLDMFSPPRGLDEKQLATRIIQISDSFARRMPTDGSYEEKVAAVLTRIMDTHQSNTWPPQAAFVMAMPNREQSQFAAAETFNPKSEADMIEGRMEKGQPVPETAIWGQLASKLPHRHLDTYRNASVKAWLDTLGHKAADAMYSKYGAIVAPYFPSKATSEPAAPATNGDEW
jgi:hypothetical protein